MSELNVVATIPVKAEHVESAAAPGVFVTVERWTDQAALDAHMQTPHVAAAFAAAGDALAGDVAIHPLVPVTV